PKFAYERVAAGQPMPGVIAIPKDLPIGQAIEEMHTVIECLDRASAAPRSSICRYEQTAAARRVLFHRVEDVPLQVVSAERIGVETGEARRIGDRHAVGIRRPPLRRDGLSALLASASLRRPRSTAGSSISSRSSVVSARARRINPRKYAGALSR